MEILFGSIYLFVLLIAAIISSYFRRKNIVETGKDWSSLDSENREWIIFAVLIWPASLPLVLLFIIIIGTTHYVSRILDWLHLRIGEILVK